MFFISWVCVCFLYPLPLSFLIFVSFCLSFLFFLSLSLSPLSLSLCLGGEIGWWGGVVHRFEILGFRVPALVTAWAVEIPGFLGTAHAVQNRDVSADDS